MKKDIVVEERTDRNGTKHQVVNTSCDRCGGAGGHDVWKVTGWTCFKCGGSGRMLAKRKVYTPEHEEKLRKQREKRAEKIRQEIIAQAQEKNIETLSNWGYGQEKIYVVLGDTFPIKDELKEAGAKFNRQVMSWFFAEKPEQWETFELETAKLVWYNDLGEVRMNYDEEVSEYMKAEKNKLVHQSEYIGEVGEKIEIELTVLKSFWLESYSYYASVCVNKMQDEQGNIVVWKTGKDLEDEADENGKIKLKGTIKEHSEYREEKQTVLTRCKLISLKVGA